MRAEAAWLALALTEEEAVEESDVVDLARSSNFCLKSKRLSDIFTRDSHNLFHVTHLWLP